MVSRHLIIRGLVQGVGFRYATVIEASRLGLSGWVRNRRDGSVEVVACGPDANVTALISWAHRGPPSARVDHVEVEAWPEMFDGEFTQFATA